MLDAYTVTLQLIRKLVKLVEEIEKHDRDLADQIRRAANSVLLNLNEGRKNKGGTQARFFAYARGWQRPPQFPVSGTAKGESASAVSVPSEAMEKPNTWEVTEPRS